MTDTLVTLQAMEQADPLPVPMSAPDLTELEREAVARVLRTASLSIGPELASFEKAVAAHTGVPHAIGVSSGTSGLHLCVIASGVGAGDYVITSPFSFVASANCILYEQAVPIFVDVDPETGNLDAALVAEAVSDFERRRKIENRWLPPSHRRERRGRLKALLPVHAFGQVADMQALTTVARSAELAVIEDACEAIGAEYQQRRAGTFGDAAVFAFYPNKQMTTGEGGMIVTPHAEWDQLFRSLRNQGRDVFDSWLAHSRLGYNYRLDEMSAALGAAQMQRLDDMLAQRAQVAAWYGEGLAGLAGIEPPRPAAATTFMSWFVYVVRVVAPADRNTVMRGLAAAGIPSRPYFSPIHLQPFIRDQFGYQRGDFPVTEYLGDVSLALPFSGVMRQDQVERVCSTLRAVLPS